MILSTPVFLYAGLAVAAILLVAHWSRARRRRLLAESLGGPRAGRRLSRSNLYRPTFERATLVVLAALAIGVGAAEPRLPTAEPDLPAPQRIRSIVIALDVSASMQASDAPPTRLGHSVRIAESLMDELGRDRVGLLLFAGEAYPLAPPTHDHDALRYLLGGVTPTIASAHDPGTLLSVGVRSSVALIATDEDDAGERAIIVIADGEDGEVGNAMAEAAAEAAAAGIVVHAIGVGTVDGAGMVMPQAPYQLGGRILDSSGAAVVSHLQEPTLARLAAAGGGRYVNAGEEGGLDDLYRSFRAPEPDPAREASLWARYEPTAWLILGALLFLLFESFADMRTPRGWRVPRRREA